jgi:hypothetical protein
MQCYSFSARLPISAIINLITCIIIQLLSVASNRDNSLRRANLPSVRTSRGQDGSSSRSSVRILANERAIGFQINAAISLNNSRDTERVVGIMWRTIERDIKAVLGTIGGVGTVELDGHIGWWRWWRGGDRLSAGDGDYCLRGADGPDAVALGNERGWVVYGYEGALGLDVDGDAGVNGDAGDGEDVAGRVGLAVKGDADCIGCTSSSVEVDVVAVVSLCNGSGADQCQGGSNSANG